MGFKEEYRSIEEEDWEEEERVTWSGKVSTGLGGCDKREGKG